LGIGKFHIGLTELFSYLFYLTSTILIGYSVIPLLFNTPCLKNNWIFQKNNQVNTRKAAYLFLWVYTSTNYKYGSKKWENVK